MQLLYDLKNDRHVQTSRFSENVTESRFFLVSFDYVNI